jgi:hypothetical protein
LLRFFALQNEKIPVHSAHQEMLNRLLVFAGGMQNMSPWAAGQGCRPGDIGSDTGPFPGTAQGRGSQPNSRSCLFAQKKRPDFGNPRNSIPERSGCYCPPDYV